MLKHSNKTLNSLKQNPSHNFAMGHSMMLYRKNVLYSFIPKNGCSTLRLSAAIENGCISGIEQGHWIHTNNQTFNATLAEAIKIDYSFVVLRCPFKRLASVFLDKFVSKEPDAWQYRNQLERKVELDELTFREFVYSLKKPAIFRSNIHWRPQNEFLIYNEYSDYFSLENFSYAIRVLKEKVDFNVIDARSLTNHGTDGYTELNQQCYAGMAAFDIALLKRNGECPSHIAMYDEELYGIVTELYKQDVGLYMNKCQASKMMQKADVAGINIDIKRITFDEIKTSAQVDYLRDEAVRLESSDLPMSYKLMSLAYQARPTGLFIKKKFDEYTAKLSVQS
ncbi:sulfotransferase family 2 domain-containing protein [Vibrio sp. 10N.222.51.C5]|uniref:sulfotransferase family 2 domain-containing protein n=1 Tax=Vibrio sp. 10N.222.51.C5 TaxID=3229623 RepID=UPI00354DF9DC